MSLRDRANKIVDSEKDTSDSTERIIQMTKVICKNIIQMTEEDIKKGNYRCRERKKGLFGLLGTIKYKVVYHSISYFMISNPQEPTPYYSTVSRAWYLKTDYEVDLFVREIQATLEKEGFKINLLRNIDTIECVFEF